MAAGFEPALGWLLGYIGTKGADSILTNVRGGELINSLHTTVEAWASQLPSDATLNSSHALFPSHIPDTELIDRPALSDLRATFQQSVPTKEQWKAALMEQWHHIRGGTDQAQLFFRIEEARAEEHLANLAGQLVDVCARDKDLFRATVVELLRELQGRVEQQSGLNLQPLTDEKKSHYFIPDYDDNRNVFLTSPGTPEQRWSYSIVRTSFVLQALGNLNIYDWKSYLLDDEIDDWRQVMPFSPGEANWPHAGPTLGKRLTVFSDEVSESLESTTRLLNQPDASIHAGTSMQLIMNGWILTPYSLSRETFYDVLTAWHINTTYFACLLRLFEIRESMRLGYHQFEAAGDPPFGPAQRWAKWLAKSTGREISEAPPTFRIEDV